MAKRKDITNPSVSSSVVATVGDHLSSASVVQPVARSKRKVDFEHAAEDTFILNFYSPEFRVKLPRVRLHKTCAVTSSTLERLLQDPSKLSKFVAAAIVGRVSAGDGEHQGTLWLSLGIQGKNGSVLQGLQDKYHPQKGQYIRSFIDHLLSFETSEERDAELTRIALESNHSLNCAVSSQKEVEIIDWDADDEPEQQEEQPQEEVKPAKPKPKAPAKKAPAKAAVQPESIFGSADESGYDPEDMPF